jgi:hypothetical protein
MKTKSLVATLAGLLALGIASPTWAQDAAPKKKPPAAKASPVKKPVKKPAKAPSAKKTAKKRPGQLKNPFTKKRPPKRPGQLKNPYGPAAKPLPKTAPVKVVPKQAFEGVLGVMVGKLTPRRRMQLGAPPMAGLHVSRVLPGTVASVAGLRKGDVIIDVAGVTTRRVTDVGKALGQMHVGDLLIVQVIRNKRPQTLFATLSAPGGQMAKKMRGSKRARVRRKAPASASLDGRLHFAQRDAVGSRIDRRMKRLRRRVKQLKKRRRRRLRWRR